MAARLASSRRAKATFLLANIVVVDVETCPDCMGILLDAGEARKLAEAYRWS